VDPPNYPRGAAFAWHAPPWRCGAAGLRRSFASS